MEVRYFKTYSNCLGRDMEFKVYGHRGKPVLFIPCQAGRFFDFENFHMDDVFRPWIDAGKIMVFSIDTIDGETWQTRAATRAGALSATSSGTTTSSTYSTQRCATSQASATGSSSRPFRLAAPWAPCTRATSSSRRPDLFDGVLALSGIYDSRESFGDYMDDLVYQNSPCDYLANMPEDHPYIAMYNERRAIFCVGQGAWEDQLRESTARLDRVLRAKGIHAWVDFLGLRRAHDWTGGINRQPTTCRISWASGERRPCPPRVRRAKGFRRPGAGGARRR